VAGGAPRTLPWLWGALPAWASGVSLVRLRKSVAFDRLLARLFTVAPDRWVLKGGLALDYRLGTKARNGPRCHRGCRSR